MLGDIQDASSTGSTHLKKEGLESHLYFSKTAEVVLRLKELLILESTPSADDLEKSLYRPALSGF